MINELISSSDDAFEAEYGLDGLNLNLSSALLLSKLPKLHLLKYELIFCQIF